MNWDYLRTMLGMSGNAKKDGFIDDKLVKIREKVQRSSEKGSKTHKNGKYLGLSGNMWE